MKPRTLSISRTSMQTQDYNVAPVRDAAILTTSYVDGTVIGPLTSPANPALANQLNLLVDLTIGSLTTAEVMIEYSPDGSAWYQETFEDISNGIATLTNGVYQFSATGKYVISCPIKFAYIRVSAKGSGTATGSSMSILAVVGTV